MLKNDHYRKLENMMHSAPFVQLAGARAEISQGQAEITLPVKHELFHAADALHGALYFLALDNAAFFAVNSLVEDVFVLTVSFNVYLLRPVDQGVITAVGKVVNSAKTQYLAESCNSTIKIAAGQTITVNSGTQVQFSTPETVRALIK